MSDRPIRIGMVCYPTYGGSGALATELGRMLARRGHTVHFISYSRPVRLAHESHKNIVHHRIDTMEYPLFLGPLYGISTSVRIYDIIREGQLDLLHVHYALPHAICAHLATEMLEPDERIPVMTTLHGTDITLIGNTPAFRPAVKLGLDKSDSLTCVSDWLADQTCQHFDICDRLNVIYNFVDPEVYKREQPGVERGEFAADDEAILLHVSNFRPVKRVLDVVRTFAAVCAETPARLLLVGDGPDRESALAQGAALGVADRIRFLGEQADVKNYFSIADVLLFPSAGESFGLAAAEAMASEVPVIGTRAGGMPEVVVEGESGFLCEVGDYQAMAQAALRLIYDPAMRETMGKAGRRRIIERFSPDIIVPQYEACYESMLRRSAVAV